MTDSRRRLPNEVATQLRISPSTLRRWSTEFAHHLSEMAGRLHGEDESGAVHRRYTDKDLETLMTIKGLLAEGLTYIQVGRRLEALRMHGGGVVMEDGAQPVTAIGPSFRESSVAPAMTVLADTLHTVADGQQLLIGSQQANRELLTVVLQDNFSLKEENARLRDRMLEMERDLVAMRRIEDTRRDNLESRLRRVEEQIRFQIQGKDGERPGCLSRLLGP